MTTRLPHAGGAAPDPEARRTVGSLDLAQYLLTTSATVAEARTALAAVTVVGVLEPSIGIPPPIHLIVTEPSGQAIVIEFIRGETKIHDAPLSVITNSPAYDWHVTNLRNYLNLSAVSLPDKKIEDLDFKPLGDGSGMIGLPGDFTPPSRFVRAVAFAKTAASVPSVTPPRLYRPIPRSPASRNLADTLRLERNPFAI